MLSRIDEVRAEAILAAMLSGYLSPFAGDDGLIADLLEPDRRKRMASQWSHIGSAIQYLRDQRLMDPTAIAGVTSQAALQSKMFGQPANQAMIDKLNRELQKSVASGEGARDWSRRMRSIVGTRHAYEETISRTATHRAYHDGQRKLLDGPAGAVFPYRQLHATRDTRVRDTHWEFDGRVYHKDSPTAKQVAEILAEYNCRCTERPITRKEALRLGIDDDAGWIDPEPEETGDDGSGQEAAPVWQDFEAELQEIHREAGYEKRMAKFAAGDRAVERMHRHETPERAGLRKKAVDAAIEADDRNRDIRRWLTKKGWDGKEDATAFYRRLPPADQSHWKKLQDARDNADQKARLEGSTYIREVNSLGRSPEDIEVDLRPDSPATIDMEVVDRLGPDREKKLQDGRQWVQQMLRRRAKSFGHKHMSGDTLSIKAKEPVVSPGERTSSYYNNGSIYFKDGDDVSVVIHEVGHAIEDQPNIKKAFQEFRKKRVGAKAKPVPLRDIIPGSGYDATEKTLGDDDWRKTFALISQRPGDRAYYAGKEYKGGSTELLSMGLEVLYADPQGFAETDPEYFKLVLGALNGVFD